MSSNTALLLRKMVVTFLTAFFSALIVSLEGISSQPTFGWSKSVIIAALVGAIGAGIRAVLAFSPLNLVPSDYLHTIGGRTTTPR